MRTADLAKACYDADQAFLAVYGGTDQTPPWDTLPMDARSTALTSVTQALLGATPEEVHDAWRTGMTADGWTYGATLDSVAKTHPYLVAYASLPLHKRAKDALFRNLVTALAKY